MILESENDRGKNMMEIKIAKSEVGTNVMESKLLEDKNDRKSRMVESEICQIQWREKMKVSGL